MIQTTELTHYADKACEGVVHGIAAAEDGTVWTLSGEAYIRVWKWRGSTQSDPSQGVFDVQNCVLCQGILKLTLANSAEARCNAQCAEQSVLYALLRENIVGWSYR